MCELLTNSQSEADEEATGAGAEHGLGGGGRGGVDQGGEEEAEQETVLGGARHGLGCRSPQYCCLQLTRPCSGGTWSPMLLHTTTATQGWT